MKVVIVAKTRMGRGACVGGITFDGCSLRLIAPDADENEAFNAEYEVGDVWEIDDYSKPGRIPPHVEDIVVQHKRRLPPIDDVVAFVEERMPPLSGGPEVLYEGKLQATRAGALYVAERNGVPASSTLFWRPDQPLQREESSKRIRYRYPAADGGRTLTFVGFQEPLPEIPAGTLLRVSLAHWWRAPDKPDGELCCYVQLSGWYLPEQQWPGDWWNPPETEEASVTPAPHPSVTVDGPANMETAQEVLEHVFGFDDFRPLQQAIIEQLLDGKDGLAVMPTGSGKSLCYQLPALLFDGLTVVVSPLIALMQDQVEQLREIGVPAAFLNSTLSYDGYLQTAQAVRAGRTKLLYAAPETLLRPETLLLLEQSNVSCLAIDEAHCISEWGHDFRPEYRQLAEVRSRLPQAVCLAVTATATERVRDDIIESLNIARSGAFLASFNRENLLLRVEPRFDGLQQTLTFLASHRGEAGIIYCSTRSQVDSLAAELQARGWPALPYHAGLDDATRRENQRRFTHGEETIIVATIAFGMGIDKPNVRFVLHHDLPKNLDSYYQQIGRAGRDGLPAECLLLFAYNDVQTINYFIQQESLEQQRGARWRLDAMIAFAETNGCRRAPLLAYFGETYDAESCDNCDNCLVGEQELHDLTVPAQKFLSCVRRTGEIFGMTHVIDVLRGSRSQRVLDRHHDELSTHGIGQEFSKKEWQYLARQFIQQGLLTQDMQHGSLRLTPLAYEVFRGKAVMGSLPEKASMPTAQAAKADELPYDRNLFALLRAHRLKLAEEAGIPPYAVFPDRTLIELATYFPHSAASFGHMHGVGDVKLAKYADEFLPIVRRHCQENGVSERPKAGGQTTSRKRARSILTRTDQIAAWYNNGESVATIAQREGIQENTVLQHLVTAAGSGTVLRLDGLRELSSLEADEQERVLAKFAEHGPELLRPVFDALSGSISWEELRILQLYYVAREQNR
jgi:ATP-dependent DNA helicase RecQ